MTNEPKRLLVNADDLGLSTAINAGIIEGYECGIVTSTSIVASGEAFDQAVQLTRSYSGLGVGVHLTLVEENSVSDKIPTLAPHGVLPGSYGELVGKVLTGRIRLADIEQEFCAQVEKVLRAGIKPTHLDSHQHTHALPLIFPIAVRIANQYAIPCIRLPRGVPSWRDINVDRFLPKCALCVFAHADAILFSRESCLSTDRFVGLFESGALSQDRLIDVLRGLRPGTSELVCHPGCDDPTPRYCSWNKRRQLELTSLTDASVKQLVRQLGIELINYRQL